MFAAFIEIVIRFLGEFVFELVLELLVEVSLFALIEKARLMIRSSALVEGSGFVLIGALMGGASTYVLPRSLIVDADLRLLNLIITPLLAGLAMMGVGALRRRYEQEPIRLDTFAFGALFAFSFELVRIALVR